MRNASICEKKREVLEGDDWDSLVDMLIKEVALEWEEEYSDCEDSEMLLQDILSLIDIHIPSFAATDIDFIRRVTQLMVIYQEKRTIDLCLKILHHAFENREVLSNFCHGELIDHIFGLVPFFDTAGKIMGQFSSIDEYALRMLIETGDLELISSVLPIDTGASISITEDSTIAAIMESSPEIIATLLLVIYDNPFIEPNLQYLYERGILTVVLIRAKDYPFHRQRLVLSMFLHFLDKVPASVLHELGTLGLVEIICKHLEEEDDEFVGQLLEALPVVCPADNIHLMKLIYQSMRDNHNTLANIDGFYNQWTLIQAIVEEQEEL